MLKINSELNMLLNNVDINKYKITDKREYAPMLNFLLLALTSTYFEKENIGYLNLSTLMKNLGFMTKEQVSQEFAPIIKILTDKNIVLKDKKELKNSYFRINPHLLLKEIIIELQNLPDKKKIPMDKRLKVLNSWLSEDNNKVIKKVSATNIRKVVLNQKIKNQVKRILLEISNNKDIKNINQLQNNIITENFKMFYLEVIQEYLENKKYSENYIDTNILVESIFNKDFTNQFFKIMFEQNNKLKELEIKKIIGVFVDTFFNKNIKQVETLIDRLITKYLKTLDFFEQEFNRLNIQKQETQKLKDLNKRYEIIFNEFQSQLLNTNLLEFISYSFSKYSKFILTNNLTQIFTKEDYNKYNFFNLFKPFILTIGEHYYFKDSEMNYNNINPVFIDNSMEQNETIEQNEYNFIFDLQVMSIKLGVKEGANLFLELCKIYYYLNSFDSLKVNLPYY